MCSKWGIYGLGLVVGLLVCAEALAAGSTIDAVWMRYGGARTYYDALMEPKQMDTQGMRRKDPALMRNLPPITEVKPQPTRHRSTARTATVRKIAAPASAGLPAGQVTSARPTPPSVATSQATKAPVATTPGNGARAPIARNGGALGGLEPAQNNNDVFVPPPKAANVPGGGATSASSGAATSSTGAGGRVTGAGQTSR